MKYYYSINSGSTWEGPFSKEEMDNFRAIGIIDSQTMVKNDAPVNSSPGLPSTSPTLAADPQTSTTAPPSTEGYFVMINGTPQGPYVLSDLQQLINQGSVRPTDLAWTQGMEQWVPVCQIVPIANMGNNLASLSGFSLSTFFAEVFKRHTVDEMQDCFIAGTRQGTPPLSSVSTVFPAPWIFARIMFFCLILYFGFGWALEHYQNSNLVPGYIFVGNFGIPFCCFLLFFELNVRRDVSLYSSMKALIGGGLLSLIITLFLFDSFQSNEAIWAGAIEEPAKLFAAILIAGKLRNGHILTGLIMGAAVGAGFAAFESAGYTYNTLIALIRHQTVADIAIRLGDSNAAAEIMNVARNFNPETIMEMRALMTPFGHVVWTAVTAGAYWYVLGLKVAANERAKDDTSIDFSIFADMRFLRLALIPVGLHMLWNSGIVFEKLGQCIGSVAIGVVAWIIALRLVKQGCDQIKIEQSQTK